MFYDSAMGRLEYGSIMQVIMMIRNLDLRFIGIKYTNIYNLYNLQNIGNFNVIKFSKL